MRLRIWTAILCALCLPLCAQAQQKPQVQLQFVCFPKSADTSPVHLNLGAGQSMEVELPSGNVSKVYTVDALSKWVLGKTDIDEEGNPIFIPYGETKSSGTKKQLILVIRKGANNADGLQLTAMNASQDGFGSGKYLLFNASKADIAGKLGDAEFRIKPGRHTMLKPNPSREARDKKYLHTYLYFRKGDKAQPFYSSTWRYNETVRCFVFVYHDPHNKRLRTHSIRDYLP